HPQGDVLVLYRLQSVGSVPDSCHEPRCEVTPSVHSRGGSPLGVWDLIGNREGRWPLLSCLHSTSAGFGSLQLGLTLDRSDGGSLHYIRVLRTMGGLLLGARLRAAAAGKVGLERLRA